MESNFKVAVLCFLVMYIAALGLFLTHKPHPETYDLWEVRVHEDLGFMTRDQPYSKIFFKVSTHCWKKARKLTREDHSERYFFCQQAS